MRLSNVNRYIRLLLAILSLALAGLNVSAYTLPFTPYPKIEINGNNTLSFNLNQIDGSSSFYSDDNAGKDKTFTSSSNLLITGELYKDLLLNATMTANPYSPNDFKWNLRYNGQDAKVLLGDFNANLAGNEYVLLNRSLQGLQVDAVLPKGTLTLIGSNLQSPVKTDTFYGQNITGPYYLTSSPIVDGSEIVAVNDQRMTRTTDYSIDYTSGILNFTAGHIISPADKVTVSYEVAQTNGMGGGRLYALRASYPLADNFQIGLSQMMLEGSSQGPVDREERDQFLGNGTPGPFYLRSRPILLNSEQVTINGVVVPAVTAAGDHPYTLNYQDGNLLFSQTYAPPAGSTVIVRYHVQLAANNGGDRSVTGLDMNWTLPFGLGFNMQAATSNNPGGGSGNNALSFGANYNKNGLTASAKYRDVGAGFSPLEMVGYRNIRKELEWALNYSPTKFLTFATSGNNTRLPLNPYDYTTTDQSLEEENNRQFTIDYHPDNWPRLVYQHSSQNTSQLALSDLGNNSSTDSLRMTVARQHLNGTLEFNRVKTNSNQLSDPTNPDSTLYKYDGTTDNAALNLQFQPNDRFNMGVNLAANRISADGTNGMTSTNGSNAQVNATFRASNNLSFTSSLSMNQTGAAQNVAGTNISALKDRNLNFSADWRPTKTVSVNLAANKTRTDGGDYSNSQSDNLTANVGWQVNKRTTVNGYWSRQNLTYLGTPGGSVSNMVGMNTEFQPVGKLKINLDAQHLWGETSTAVNQMLSSQAMSRMTVQTQLDSQYATTATGNKLTTLAARVSYPLSKKQELFVTGETTRSDGFPSQSTKNAVSLGWNYHFNDNLTFTVNGGRVQYSDQSNPSLNYGANQLNAQFSWNF